jgi:prolyl-tRNA editing enzyme YbaK/EbsC (Cys-tRNA(Pro) deacylase)
MAIDNVKKYFKQYNIENRIIELTTSSATVKEAAESLGTEECKIAKTLSFLVEEKPILIVAAGDAKIDNSKYKEFFSTKAKMIPAIDVENLIGHNIGGVCPFAIKDGISVYLDNSLLKYETVFPACGSSNSAIELTALELEKYSQNFKGWVDVSKDITE